MNLVQESFLRMKVLARESDKSNEDLFKTISQAGLKKDFNIIDEKAETLETGEQYQIQSYIQKLQSAIQNLIESYTNGTVNINDSRDLLGKYNELSLYLNTKVKYGSLSIREQNIINKEIENITPLVQELQFLAERLDLSYASVYKQLYENLKMYKYVPITLTKETKDKLIKKTKESYNIQAATDILTEWASYIVRINMSAKYIDPYINDRDVKAANDATTIVDFGKQISMLLTGSGISVSRFFELVAIMQDALQIIADYNASTDVNEKKEINNRVNSNLSTYSKALAALKVIYKNILEIIDTGKSNELTDIKRNIEEKLIAKEMERLEKARVAKEEIIRKRLEKQERNRIEQQRKDAEEALKQEEQDRKVQEFTDKIARKRREEAAREGFSQIRDNIERNKEKRRSAQIDGINEKLNDIDSTLSSLYTQQTALKPQYDAVPLTKSGTPNKSHKVVRNYEVLDAKIRALLAERSALMADKQELVGAVGAEERDEEGAAAAMPEDDSTVLTPAKFEEFLSNIDAAISTDSIAVISKELQNVFFDLQADPRITKTQLTPLDMLLSQLIKYDGYHKTATTDELKQSFIDSAQRSANDFKRGVLRIQRELKIDGKGKPTKKGKGKTKKPVKQQQSAAQLAWRKKVKDCMAKYGCSMKEALQKLKKN